MILNISFLLMWVWRIFPSTWEKLKEYRQAEHIEEVNKPQNIRAIEALIPLDEEIREKDICEKEIPLDCTGSVKPEQQNSVRDSTSYLKRKRAYQRLKALHMVWFMWDR